VGVPAEVQIHALPDLRLSGKVARTGFALDPATATMRAEIDVANEKGLFRPGMTVTVELNLGKGPADALRVPLTAVVGIVPTQPGAPESAVYVLRNGKAHRTPIRTGFVSDKEVEVGSGLGADDLVVTDPKGFGLKAEVEVRPEREPK
jgi:multidrug efflux pump subunit AcrA (membrane-fusion protein)